MLVMRSGGRRGLGYWRWWFGQRGGKIKAETTMVYWSTCTTIDEAANGALSSLKDKSLGGKRDKGEVFELNEGAV